MRQPLSQCLIGLLCLPLLTACAATSAGTVDEHGQTHVVNVDRQGLALQGYDPVSYFTEAGPTPGQEKLTHTHQGATYRFASAENRDRFASDPASFAPAYGGYCGYGLAKNMLAPVDPEAYDVINGRLVLQYSKGVRKTFHKDLEGNLQKADANWPLLAQRDSAP